MSIPPAIEHVTPGRIPIAHRVRITFLTPSMALALLLLISLLLRVYRLDEPNGSLIFDEKYYVNATRVIQGIPVAEREPYSAEAPGRDPNREHPPLGKVMISASMAAIGDSPLGWRFPSIVSGLAAIALVYGIVRSLGGDGWLAVLAATGMAVDNLAIVHGRIATLDMMLVTLLLLGAWCFLRDWPLPAGMSLALAALVKLNGVFGLVAMLLVCAIRGYWRWRDSGKQPGNIVRDAVIASAAFVICWLVGLWALDSAFTTFLTPWDHLTYMLTYGLALARDAGPANSESYPWHWLINEAEMPYLRVDVRGFADGQVFESRSLIYFRGAMNPAIAIATLPAVAYSGWRVWRFRDLVGLWVVAWFIATHLPYYPLSLISHRITFIYYFLPTLPCVVVAIAQLLKQGGLPRPALWAYGVTVGIGFITYFPLRLIP